MIERTQAFCSYVCNLGLSVEAWACLTSEYQLPLLTEFEGSSAQLLNTIGWPSACSKKVTHVESRLGEINQDLVYHPLERVI